MGFFRKKTQTRDTQTITPAVDDVLLSALLNNEVITREKALTLPAVSGAVEYISGAVASIPIKLYKRKGRDTVELTEDPRVALLNGDTGDTLDAFQMKKAMVTDYLLGKGGYCLIERRRNEVKALRYIEDKYIEIWKSYDVVKKTYRLLVQGAEYESYDFLKLLRNTKDGASGVGYTVEIGKILETAYQTMLYQLSMVQSGGNKRGFLKSERKLGQEEINVLKDAWKKMYEEGTEKVVVLNNGLDFQESANTSVEMQIDEITKEISTEIKALFQLDSTDYYLVFKKAIYPILRAMETALNRDLLLEKEKATYFFKCDNSELLKADIKQRYEAYKVAKDTGFLTINEIRAMEDLSHIEGLDVVNVGLSAVLYDTDTHKYYTPNTGTAMDFEHGQIEKISTDNQLSGEVEDEHQSN